MTPKKVLLVVAVLFGTLALNVLGAHREYYDILKISPRANAEEIQRLEKTFKRETS